jgi:uncharacterized protein (DUF952 family)
MSRELIFKIVPRVSWDAAVAIGVFEGAPVDLEDGFIHFSTARQVGETARRHFCNQSGLVIVAFDPKSLGDRLKWEPSRGGELFPHLYDRLDPALALWVEAMPLDPEGVPIVPERVKLC